LSERTLPSSLLRVSVIGQERLNALLLLFVHHDIQVDVDEVVDVVAKNTQADATAESSVR